MRARRIALPMALILGVTACVDFGSPPGPPEGTYAERLVLFAGLLRMEDRRDYEPLLTSRAAISPDPWVRAKAALAVGRLRDPAGSPYLVILLRDEAVEVRRAAAFASGLAGDARLLPHLLRSLSDDDPKTVDLAVEALGKLGGKEAVDALTRLATERPAAAQALFRFPSAAATEHLRGVAGPSAPRPHRKAAVYALARRPIPEAAPILREALRSDDPELVAYAARGLGVLRDAASADALAGLAWSREASVSIQSMAALERIGAKAKLPEGALRVALQRANEDIPVSGVGVAALRLLARGKDYPEAASRLETVATSGDGWLPQVALAGLAAVAPARFEALYDGGSLERRLGAAEALGVLPLDAARKLAPKLLADGNSRVRALALASLPKDLRTDELLLAALGDQDAGVRAGALELATPPSPALEKAWTAAYEASFRIPEPDFVVTSLDAAAGLGKPGRELLERRVDARDPVVREKARRLLAERYNVSRDSFRRIPVTSRYTRADLQRIARAANETEVMATLETKRGSFTIDLAREDAPLTVENFVTLARRGYFDRIVFHRIVPDFVVQGGDPRGDGNGGPGYAIRDEVNPRRYERGAVGMALSGPDTGGSQWFVTLSPQPHLDGGYTVFGFVSTFLEVADRLQQDDEILSVTIEETARESRPFGARD